MLRRWEGRSVEALRAAWGLPRLEVHAEIGSTNDRAREAAHAGAPAGSVVLAEWQQAGRGRRGRSWIAAPGESLLASIVLRPPASGVVAPALPLRVGLTAARVCRELCDAPVDVKWPNDLLVHGRKLGGILCEASSGGSGGSGGSNTFVVVGIGINVVGVPAEWPAGTADRATSLAHAATRPVGRLELAAALLPAIARLDCSLPLSEQELDELERRDALRGRMLLVDGEHAGTAAGFREDGALRLRQHGADRFLIHGTVHITPYEQTS